MDDPRPTDDLSDLAAWPTTEDGAQEVILRVSRWDGDKPACYQALVKHRDASRVWGVGIAPNPVVALNRAIREFYARNEDQWPAYVEKRMVARLEDGGGAVAHEMARADALAESSDDELDDLLS